MLPNAGRDYEQCKKCLAVYNAKKYKKCPKVHDI